MIRSIYNIERFPDGTPHITLKNAEDAYDHPFIV